MYFLHDRFFSFFGYHGKKSKNYPILNKKDSINCIQNIFRLGCTLRWIKSPSFCMNSNLLTRTAQGTPPSSINMPQGENWCKVQHFATKPNLTQFIYQWRDWFIIKVMRPANTYFIDNVKTCDFDLFSRNALDEGSQSNS